MGVESDCECQKENSGQCLNDLSTALKKDLYENEDDLSIDNNGLPEICISAVTIVEEPILVLYYFMMKFLSLREDHIHPKGWDSNT